MTAPSRGSRYLRPLAVIGAGRAGGSLAVCLAANDWPVAALWSRHQARARRVAAWIREVSTFRPEILSRPEAAAGEGGIHLLAVPDDAIRGMACRLAKSGKITKRHVVLHLSGAAGLQPLSPLEGCGAHTGSLHPLAVFCRTRPVPGRLAGTGFAVEGDASARSWAGRMVRRVKGIPYGVGASGRGAYHLAASLVANDAMALFLLALDQMESTELPPATCRRILGHLLESTALALKDHAPLDALTGPVVRGDAGTVRRHLATAGPGTPTGKVHALLGRILLKRAAKGGRIDPSTERRLARILRPT